eukprot:TRINITY_DN10163_c0_g2_i1.p3 TRINITY_DN10163_c0_g2~~TRINITY_DN10163_c0_g2_i1.p3  ORF type:complete len:147 (+),score=24.81 TRINITY_DN10163_c0_g2_i1:89-529(+)
MPTKVFEVEQVLYGAAPFNQVRLGYNAAAGCLNLIVPGSTSGALQIASGLGGFSGPKVSLEGLTCTVGPAVKALFCDEATAAKFASCLGGCLQAEQNKTDEQQQEAAPVTPPRATSNAAMAITPPRVKRARRSFADLAEEPVPKKL